MLNSVHEGVLPVVRPRCMCCIGTTHSLREFLLIWAVDVVCTGVCGSSSGCLAVARAMLLPHPGTTVLLVWPYSVGKDAEMISKDVS
jgi:hypothetical protein